MGNEALDQLANAALSGQTYRVLLKLLANVGFENYILVSQAELAREMNMTRPNFSRALHTLVEEGIILRGPKVGRQGSLRLNPAYGWKGKGKNHVIAMNEFRGKKPRAKEGAPAL